MYQPKAGDRVTITRAAIPGRTIDYPYSPGTWVGVLSQVSEFGFGFIGAEPGGRQVNRWLADAETLRQYGIEQTVAPA